MRLIAIATTVLALTACGGGADEETVEADLGAEVAPAVEAEAAEPPPARPAAATGDDPCAPLERELVEYDAAGTPLPMSISYPKGWKVSEMFRPSAVGLDFLYDLDDDGSHEYDLRFTTTQRVQENAEKLPALWEQIGTEVTEIELDDGTLWIGRNERGELVGYQALVPRDGAHYLLSGGVASTTPPDGCVEAAHAKVAEMLRTVRPNPDMAPMPEG